MMTVWCVCNVDHVFVTMTVCLKCVSQSRVKVLKGLLLKVIKNWLGK